MPTLDERMCAAARTVGAAELDEGALDRLGRYLDLLSLWNRRFHLTGDRDLETLVDRHVADALAVCPELLPGGHLVDIGSGAGFPGVVVACARPDVRVTLLEARRRPVSFLAEVARAIPLPSMHPILGRAEDAPMRGLGESADVVVSRAVRAEAFLPLAYPLTAAGACVLVMSTPRQDETVLDALATGLGLVPEARRDYVLPGGETRRLVRFRKPFGHS